VEPLEVFGEEFDCVGDTVPSGEQKNQNVFRRIICSCWNLTSYLFNEFEFFWKNMIWFVFFSDLKFRC